MNRIIVSSWIGDPMVNSCWIGDPMVSGRQAHGY